MNEYEIAGFIFGFIGVYLTLKENVWCFPIGLINVSISLVLFFEQRLYADSIQQLVYIILLSYGWYKWHKHPKSEVAIPIQRIQNLPFIIALIIAFLLSCILAILLKKYTNATLPWIDSFATGASFLAQWMIARKYLENWLVWIPVNLTYIIIYIYKDLPLYSILFTAYLVLAIIGYFSWKKLLNNSLIS